MKVLPAEKTKKKLIEEKELYWSHSKEIRNTQSADFDFANLLKGFTTAGHKILYIDKSWLQSFDF